METHLGFKAQEIKSSFNPEQKVWAKAYFNKQDDENLKSIRGHIFSLISINGVLNIDFDFFGKLLFSTLQNEYYQETENTPLQALENATLKCKEQLGNLASQSEKKIDTTNLDISIISAVVWGKILYIVNLGSNKAFIIRAGNTEIVSDATPDNINSVSGRVDESDTFILGNKIFSEIFEKTNDILELQKEVEIAEKTGGVAAMLVNLELEKVVAEDEKIAFISENKEQQNPQNQENLAKHLPHKKFNIKKKLPNLSKRQKLGLTTLAIGITLVLTLFLNITKTETTKLKNTEKINEETITENINNAKNYIGLNNDKARDILLSLKEEIDPDSPKVTEINELLDEVNNVQDITNSEALYDFSLKNKDFQISKFIYSQGVLYILDQQSGTLYSYEKSTGAQEVATEVKNLNYIVLCDNGLNVGSSTTLLNIDTSKSYDLTPPADFTGVGCYLNNLYFTTPNDIIKYASGSYTQSTWTNETLSNAKDNEIDSNIYIIENNTKITKLFTGNKTEFALTSLDKEPKDIEDLFINESYLYVLDSGNKRLIKTSIEGEFKEQYDISSYPAINKLWVENDQTVYLANKNTIYTFELESKKQEQ